MSERPLPLPPAWRAASDVTIAALAGLALLMALYSDEGSAAAEARFERALCEAARAWRARYPAEPDLEVVVTEVTFRGTPGDFVSGEGIVVAPVAASLAGIQDVLDVAGSPPPSRVLHVGGVTALGWPYAARLHRDIRLSGMALVRRAREEPTILPAAPSFDTLSAELKVDARLSAADLEEQHGIANCKAFGSWVTSIAGEPPYPQQIARIAEHVRARLLPAREKERRDAEDVCAAVREGKFDGHQAHVAVVLAARQLGAPSFALSSADAARPYVVATYIDGPGWLTLDLGRGGFVRGGPPILTMAPLVGEFEAAYDGFWRPNGVAYKREFNQLWGASKTKWARPSPGEDTTYTYAKPLREVCP